MPTVYPKESGRTFEAGERGSRRHNSRLHGAKRIRAICEGDAASLDLSRAGRNFPCVKLSGIVHFRWLLGCDAKSFRVLECEDDVRLGFRRVVC